MTRVYSAESECSVVLLLWYVEHGLCNGTGSVRLPVLHTAPFFRRTPLLLVCCCVPGEQEIWIDSGHPAATAPPQHGARTAANAGSAMFAAAVGSSGLTRNSGASGQISKSSPPPLPCPEVHLPLPPVMYWGGYAGIRRIPTSGFFLTAYTHLSDHK